MKPVVAEKKPINPNESAVNIQPGMRFGQRVILRRGPGDKESRHFRWWARCDCGKEDLVWATALRAGKAWACRSCAQYERNHTMIKHDGKEQSLALWARDLNMSIVKTAEHFGLKIDQIATRRPSAQPPPPPKPPSGLLKNEILRRQRQQ